MTTDYSALAAQLRLVRRARAERLERERPSLDKPGASLSLDHALDALQSRESASLLDEVEQELRAAVASAATRRPDPFAVGAFPVPLSDPFLDGVLDYYRDQWDTGLDPARLPQATVTGLAKFATDHGLIDFASAKGRMSPLGSRIAAQLAATDLPFGRDGSSKNTGKYLGLDDRIAHKIAISRERRSYLDRMPVVRDLQAATPPDRLKGFEMASIQHLFPSAVAQYEVMFASGLDPAATRVGGKFYSANVNTLAYMDARGMRLHMSATSPTGDAEDAEAEVCRIALEQLRAMFRGVDPKRCDRRFLLLDDGGKLIQALHEQLPEFAPLCVAVEQTTRGLQIIEEMRARGVDLRCPVINMAACELKRHFESPLIAESIASHIEHYLDSLGLDRLKPDGLNTKTAVVIGFGATGAATAEAMLRRGYRVLISDTSERARNSAIAAGFAFCGVEEALPQGDLVIGATGRGALRREQWGLLRDGAVLVNCASGTHELGLGALSLVELLALDRERTNDAFGTVTTRFLGTQITVGRDADDPRLEHRVIRVEGKELLALRGGAVVNMEHDLPPEYRQIIVAMLVAACFQAAGESVSGLRDFDKGMQQFLLRQFEHALKLAGLELTRPRLDDVPLPWG